MACVESKQLTEAERKTLENTARDSTSAVPSVALRGAAVREALRIIDAHASDRAALVQDRDEWQQVSRDWRYRAEQAEAEARQLKEDRAALVAQLEAANALLGRIQSWAVDNGAWVLSKKIGAHLSSPPSPAPNHAALVAQVAELTRERDEARLKTELLIEALAEAGLSKEELQKRVAELERNARVHNDEFCAESEVSQLRADRAALVAQLEAARGEALAAEAGGRRWHAAVVANGDRAEAAEARVRVLEARVEAALKWADDGLEGEALAYHMVEALRG